MATVTINEHTSKGKSLLEFLRQFDGEDFIAIENAPNEETKQAIKDVKEVNVTRTMSVADLLDKLST